MAKYYVVPYANTITTDLQMYYTLTNGVSNHSGKSFTSEDAAKRYLKEHQHKHPYQHDDKHIHVYVDGSLNHQDKQTGSGAVILDSDGSVIYKFATASTLHTNEAGLYGEILDVIQTLALIPYLKTKNYDGIKIYHDADSLSKWLTGEHHVNSKLGKQYVEQYRQLHKHIDKPVEFIKVKAHSKNHWNNVADKLAKKGSLL